MTDEKERNEIIAAAYVSAADTFDVYANDQIVGKRWQSTQKGRTECDIRASVWRDAATQLRTAAANDGH